MRITVFIPLLFLLVGIAHALVSLDAPAVDAEGKGILSKISVTATSGAGDIFVSIFPLTGVDTQHSEKTAVALAAKKAGVNASKFNVLFKIESTAEIVDGPSAGAALTVLTFAEFTGRKLRGDLTITGSIDSDGSMGKVGGIFEKARAVAEDGGKDYKVFLIPRGQRIQSGVDLSKYAKEKWNLQVVEADNIDDALDYAFNTSEGAEVQAKERVIPPLQLIPYKPSEKTDDFKEIAANEIREAKKRFNAVKPSEEVKAQIEESIKLAETLLSKKYYYSAANTAFLASITLDELSLVNGSRRDLRDKLKELNALADNLNFSKQTEGNFEWIIGAKLRYHWAKNKLEAANDGIASGNYLGASGDLAISSSWLRAAFRMNSIAATIATGKEMKDVYYRDLASKLIEDAKDLQADNLLDLEATDHLNTAIKAFEEADYLAAAFDAGFATSYAAAFEEIAELSYTDIVDQLCKTNSFELTCDIFKGKVLDSFWAELYYAHALYSFQESNRTRDPATIVNGVKLLKLSEGFEDRRKEALEILKNPPALLPASSAAPQPSREVKVEVVAVPEDSTRNLIAISILGIILLLVLYAIFVKGKIQERKLDAKERKGKIERAEELLLEGKISERSFEHFKKKYKEEKAGEGKAKRKRLK